MSNFVIKLLTKNNGAERQDKLHLNWDSFKWRNYDYTTGRFMSIDPLAEKYPYMTTYQFAGNKPSWSREIEGLESLVDVMLDINDREYLSPGSTICKTNGTGKINIHFPRAGSGTLYSSDAGKYSEKFSNKEPLRPNVWTQDVDLLNILMQNGRSSAFNNIKYTNSIIKIKKMIEQVETIKKVMSTLKEKKNNTTNSSKSLTNKANVKTDNTLSIDTIYSFEVTYPGQSEPAINISVVGKNKIDSVINNTFTGYRPQTKSIKMQIINKNNIEKKEIKKLK